MRSDDTKLAVLDMAAGGLVATYTSDCQIGLLAASPDGLHIVAGDDGGGLHFLRLEGVTPGPAVVTAWRAPQGRMQHILRSTTGLPALGCPACRTWSEVPESALGTEIACPHCGEQVRLNPFVIEADWRPVAKAWLGTG